MCSWSFDGAIVPSGQPNCCRIKARFPRAVSYQLLHLSVSEALSLQEVGGYSLQYFSCTKSSVSEALALDYLILMERIIPQHRSYQAIVWYNW